MTVCAIKCCRNYEMITKQNKAISFHRFPTDPCLASGWINIVRRSCKEQYWEPNNSSVICSDHFHRKRLYTTDKGYQKLKKGAIPSKALFISSVQSDDSKHSDSDIEIKPIIEGLSTCESEMTTVNNKITESPATYEERNVSIVCSSAEKPFSNSKIESTNNTQCVLLAYSEEEKPSCFRESNPTTEKSEKNMDNDIIEDFSDLDSVYDSPIEAKIRKQLRRKITLESKHTQVIRSLKRDNLRLRKNNIFLKKVIKTLKKKHYIDNMTHNQT